MRRLFVLLTASLAALALVAGAAYAGDDKPKNVKKAKRQITEAYECFLDGSLGLTIEEKAECVQGAADDPEIIQIMNEASAANPGAAEMTDVEIEKIKFTSAKKADVTWNLILGGMTLEGIAPPGEAVFVKDGGNKRVWKVAAVTNCDLLSLANPAILTGGPCAEILTG
jgi:hypothetical protein